MPDARLNGWRRWTKRPVFRPRIKSGARVEQVLQAAAATATAQVERMARDEAATAVIAQQQKMTIEVQKLLASQQLVAASRLGGKASDSDLLVLVGRETIEVPAGRFDTYLIEADGWIPSETGQTRAEWEIWVVPGVLFDIARDQTQRAGVRPVE